MVHRGVQRSRAEGGQPQRSVCNNRLSPRAAGGKKNRPFVMFAQCHAALLRSFRSRHITAFGYRPITKNATINARSVRTRFTLC
jgi:hypothetical protein